MGINLQTPELKGFVLLQTRSVWQNIPKNTLSSFFLLNELSIHNVVHETLGQQQIVRKKLSPMVLPSFFTRFFRVPSQLGKTHHLLAWKTSGKNQVILPEYFRFPGYLSSGSQSFEQSREVFRVFFPWKVCGQETSEGSIFSVKERYMFSKRVLKNWRTWPKWISEKNNVSVGRWNEDFLFFCFICSFEQLLVLQMVYVFSCLQSYHPEVHGRRSQEGFISRSHNDAFEKSRKSHDWIELFFICCLIVWISRSKQELASET